MLLSLSVRHRRRRVLLVPVRRRSSIFPREEEITSIFLKTYNYTFFYLILLLLSMRLTCINSFHISSPSSHRNLLHHHHHHRRRHIPKSIFSSQYSKQHHFYQQQSYYFCTLQKQQQRRINSVTSHKMSNVNEDNTQKKGASAEQGTTNSYSGTKNSANGDETNKIVVSAKRKVHTMTVCLVPPPENNMVWQTVNGFRRKLKDPGYYRWPPHANLLYPFVQIQNDNNDDKNDNNHIDSVEKNKTNDDGDADGNSNNKVDDKQPDLDDDDNYDIQSIVKKLHNATQQCSPFNVSLDTCGTFGGKQRGVLWLYPRSTVLPSHSPSPSSSSTTASTFHAQEENKDEPLKVLHRLLEEAFPMCTDQTKGGTFHPHMTISHFENIADAKMAQRDIEREITDILSGEAQEEDDQKEQRKLSFIVDHVYVLQRIGDDGQFLRVADIGLGKNSSCKIHYPNCIAFPQMPTHEEEWVYEERMKQKSRRNRKGRGGRGGGRGESRGGRGAGRQQQQQQQQQG